MKIEWSPLALERVSDIARYLAQDKPSAAEKWVNALFDTVERLGEFPESGRKVPELDNSKLREVIYGAYRVIYRVQDNIEILTVRRGSQLLRMDEIE